MNQTIHIASFDIGKRNFAFTVEEVDLDKVEKNSNDKLNKACMNGRVVLFKNIDLTHEKNVKDLTGIFRAMTKTLNEYQSYWDRCSYFIIEQQMSFRSKVNVTAIKLGQHCYSYFSIMYGSFKNIIEFPAYHKTKVFNSVKMTKYQRKKWAIEKAKSILTERKDLENLKTLETSKKKDDYSDTLVQLQAFKIMTFY